MRDAWKAIQQIAGGVIVSMVFVLAILGLPLALVISLVFHRRFWSSSRAGKLGLEDIFRGFSRLAVMSGLATVLLLATFGLLFGR
jgi:hypothetical protein